MLNMMFPFEEVLEEYRHPDILVSNYPLELDFYYPKLNLALESQVSVFVVIVVTWHLGKATLQANVIFA
jgi:hypothetical protein